MMMRMTIGLTEEPVLTDGFGKGGCGLKCHDNEQRQLSNYILFRFSPSKVLAFEPFIP